MQPAPASLQLGVTGLPAGSSARITLQGPNGSSQTLTGPQSLTDLNAGSYAITANPVKADGFTYTATVSAPNLDLAPGGTGTSSVAYKASTGKLSVTVTGLDAHANLTVTGPDGQERQVTASTVLSDLEPGRYALTAKNARVPGTVVDSLFDVTAFSGSATVTAGSTGTAGATYAKRGGTGSMWVAGERALLGYSDAQLSVPGTSRPVAASAIRETPDGHSHVAFDAAGNLWVINNRNNTLSKYTAAQLASNDSPSPAVVLTFTNPAHQFQQGIAFDDQGNLWTAGVGPQLLKFAPGQLEQDGSPTPVATVSLALQDFNVRPWSLAFDAQGNLWMTNSTNNAPGEETIVRLTPAQLAAGGTTKPLVIRNSNSVLDALTGLAFDAQGNLWVASGGNNRIVKYSPDQLQASGAPTPRVVIEGVEYPFHVAFDSSGNLWANSFERGTLNKFTPDQLARSGSPTPATTIREVLGADVGKAGCSIMFAFSPTPTGLPLVAGKPLITVL